MRKEDVRIRGVNISPTEAGYVRDGLCSVPIEIKSSRGKNIDLCAISSPFGTGFHYEIAPELETGILSFCNTDTLNEKGFPAKMVKTDKGLALRIGVNETDHIYLHKRGEIDREYNL